MSSLYVPVGQTVSFSEAVSEADVYLPVGTCRMGSDERAVVDTSLRVRGVDGLRVVDASIMPRLVSANTNVTAIMIGERAARFVRGNT